MTPEMTEKLRRSLILHEGKSNLPYIDTVGKITIGIGYNLSDRGLDNEWIDSQFNKDVEYFSQQLSLFNWFLELNIDRQIALIDMCFMGFKKFLSFKKMIKAFEEKDFKKASFEMLNSKWAEQVNGRAITLAHAILTGVYLI
jgi:lysozyme